MLATCEAGWSGAFRGRPFGRGGSFFGRPGPRAGRPPAPSILLRGLGSWRARSRAVEGLNPKPPRAARA
eukprot:13863128-Alexandrium_andersonii.AAC.1